MRTERRSRRARRALTGLLLALACPGALAAAPAQGAGDAVLVAVRVRGEGAAPVTGACVGVYETPEDARPLARVCATGGGRDLRVLRSQVPTAQTWVYVKVEADAPYGPQWWGRSGGGSWQPSGIAVGDGVARVTVTLRPSAVLSGRVATAAGAPVRSGEVAFVQPWDQRLALHTAAIVDGRWSARVPPGRWYLRYTAGSVVQYAPGTSRIVEMYPVWEPTTFAPGRAVDLGTYRILPDDLVGNFVATGVVREAGSGRPLPGICLSSTGWPAESGVPWQDLPRDPARPAASADGTFPCPSGETVRTDADGRFRVPVPAVGQRRAEEIGDRPTLYAVDPQGTHRIGVVDRWAGWPRPGQERVVEVTLAPRAAVRGRVVSASGRPLAGVCPSFDEQLPWEPGWGVPPGGVPRYSVLRCSDANGWWLAGRGEPGAASTVVALSVQDDALREQGYLADSYVPGVAAVGDATAVRLVPGRLVTAPVTVLPVLASASR